MAEGLGDPLDDSEGLAVASLVEEGDGDGEGDDDGDEDAELDGELDDLALAEAEDEVEPEAELELEADAEEEGEAAEVPLADAEAVGEADRKTRVWVAVADADALGDGEFTWNAAASTFVALDAAPACWAVVGGGPTAGAGPWSLTRRGKTGGSSLDESPSSSAAARQHTEPRCGRAVAGAAHKARRGGAAAAAEAPRRWLDGLTAPAAPPIRHRASVQLDRSIADADAPVIVEASGGASPAPAPAPSVAAQGGGGQEEAPSSLVPPSPPNRRATSAPGPAGTKVEAAVTRSHRDTRTNADERSGPRSAFIGGCFSASGAGKASSKTERRQGKQIGLRRAQSSSV